MGLAIHSPLWSGFIKIILADLLIDRSVRAGNDSVGTGVGIKSITELTDVVTVVPAQTPGIFQTHCLSRFLHKMTKLQTLK